MREKLKTIFFPDNVTIYYIQGRVSFPFISGYNGGSRPNWPLVVMLRRFNHESFTSGSERLKLDCRS